MDEDRLALWSWLVDGRFPYQRRGKSEPLPVILARPPSQWGFFGVDVRTVQEVESSVYTATAYRQQTIGYARTATLVIFGEEGRSYLSALTPSDEIRALRLDGLRSLHVPT